VAIARTFIFCGAEADSEEHVFTDWINETGRSRRSPGIRRGLPSSAMPPQNPISRIEQVARDLGELATRIGDYAGPDAPRALLHWQGELRAAVDDILRLTADGDPGWRAPARGESQPSPPASPGSGQSDSQG